MNSAHLLLAAAIGLPLAMLLACVFRQVRTRMIDLLALAPVPALAASLLTVGDQPLALPASLLGVTLMLDVPGAMLLGAASLLWIGAGVYAAAYLRGDRHAVRLAPWWLTALVGNVGVFMAADVASFYLFLAMGSLAAYGLIAHDCTPQARKVGAIYVGVALLAEALVLMGLVLLAAGAPSGSLLIRDAVAALPTSPWRDPALALLIVGFGMKIGLVPTHFWMPLAYGAAPIPAAAVLSGAAVKAGVIGLVRFLPFGAILPDWGTALAIVGLLGAFYGVAIGVTQLDPKAILAYSSVSQMGLIGAAIGMGLVAGDGVTATAAAFYSAHHVLVKGALFLAVGLVAVDGVRGAWPVLLPAALIAFGLAGLPFTGGALAKIAVKPLFGEGIAGLLAALSAAGTMMLMLHFLQRLEATAPESVRGLVRGLTLPWLALALATIVVPWMLFPMIFPGGLAAEVFSLYGLWTTLWPVLLGSALTFGFWRWPRELPRIPQGDVVHAFGGLARAGKVCCDGVERMDDVLRQWPVAGLSLLFIAVVLGAAIVAGS